ncbi:NAD(P)H-flavin reductase [Malonomonas rubra DSM 5091]|uniref:NAD(P)H-flavin reductase n=1 Tax=Malonomonas rubra DSM 5091 TaxID=1122189 RepID=A0A1M6GDJ8_MALRU|nr:4Fe-4S dicluster domain-containing protein [Malonomonas rubra]SHJ07996.1 NAD(P)H-flavin reductase [Malonomonas rubra DSM 5091]
MLSDFSLKFQAEEQPERPLWRAIQSTEILHFVRSLLLAYDVIGVQKKRGRLVLDSLQDAADLVLEFPPAVHSPKKFLFPHWDQLFRFKLDENILLEAETAAPPRIIFGMHPCDLHAVKILDDCLFEGETDSSYRAKREATLLIGVDCTPDEFCFCTSLGTDRIAEGFDLFLHKRDGHYLIQTGSERGRKLLQDHAPETYDGPEESPLPLQVKQCDNKIKFPFESLPNLLEDAYDDKIWQELGHRCLGCGSCTLLCPTCYCFNVQDKLEISMQEGQRIRTWDSCQFDQFAQVANGNNFRSSQADRQRHRFFRKYKYLWEKHQRTACVGCGRCRRECLSEIEPVTVLNQMFADSPQPAETRPGSEYQPQMAQIIDVEQLSEKDRLFRLRLPQSIDFTPGSFMQISVFGLGEAPFSIASAPDGGNEIELMVRKAGTLTQALHRSRKGDSIGLRGPFGSGYPLASMHGKDLLLVAGGRGLLAIRSLLQAALADRHNFGRITLLCGARDIEALVFPEDLLDWHRSELLDCRIAVKDPDNSWGIPSLDISYLFKDLDIDPQRTIAAVSGPPEMYRQVNPLLFRMGLAEENLYLNLERHMKCGLGKCGKCQINNIYVCECGPIFPYSAIKHLGEAIER